MLKNIYTKVNFLIADKNKKREILENIKYIQENYDLVKKTIKETKKLKDLIKPHIEKYGQEMIDKFLLYWTQKNLNGRKELWEMQKVFDIPKRLATWAGKGWNEKLKTTGEVTLNDGTKAINKFGQWVDARDNNIKINMQHYPELKNY